MAGGRMWIRFSGLPSLAAIDCVALIASAARLVRGEMLRQCPPLIRCQLAFQS